MKKTILMYGNCQIGMLSKMLKTLYQDAFEIYHLQQVQNINDATSYFVEWQPVMCRVDILILQNVTQEDKDPFKKILPYISKNARVVFIDSLYNKSYAPELVITGIIPVGGGRAGKSHDINILSAFRNQVPLKEFMLNDPFYEDDFYPSSLYLSLFTQTINEFESRKELLKEKIAQQNFEHISMIPYLSSVSPQKDGVPWGDFNHPKPSIYKHILNTLVDMDILKPFSQHRFDEVFNASTWRAMNYPSYQSTKKHFKIQEPQSDNLYKLGGDFFN